MFPCFDIAVWFMVDACFMISDSTTQKSWLMVEAGFKISGSAAQKKHHLPPHIGSRSGYRCPDDYGIS
jgi:hypothetical protein